MTKGRTVRMALSWGRNTNVLEDLQEPPETIQEDVMRRKTIVTIVDKN